MEYMQKQLNHPELGRDEAKQLVLKAQAGDKEARTKLITCHMKLIFKQASKIIRKPYDNSKRLELFKDAIQEGAIGLDRAIDKFDIDKATNCSFTTYAIYWIRVRILRLLVDDYSLIKIKSTADKALFFKFSDILYISNVIDDNEKQKVEKKIINSSKTITPELLEQAKTRVHSKMLSFNCPTNMDNETELQEYISDNPDLEEVTSNSIDNQKIQQLVKDSLGILDPRSKFVIEKRILKDPKVRLPKLAEHLGISHERVRQIEVAALKKIKRFILAKAYQDKDLLEILAMTDRQIFS